MKHAVQSRTVLIVLALLLILPCVPSASAENVRATDLSRHLQLKQSSGHFKAREKLIDAAVLQSDTAAGTYARVRAGTYIRAYAGTHAGTDAQTRAGGRARTGSKADSGIHFSACARADGEAGSRPCPRTCRGTGAVPGKGRSAADPVHCDRRRRCFLRLPADPPPQA